LLYDLTLMCVMSSNKWSSLNENKVNLKKKTYPELQELLERQDKILNNR